MTKRRQMQMRRASKRYYHKLAARRRVAGLTTRGDVRIKPQYAELEHLHGRTRLNARKKLHRARLAAVGLTARGTMRQPIRTFPQLAHLHGRARRNAWLAIRRSELRGRGLTARGTEPVILTIPRRKECNWRAFRNSMNIPQREAA